MKIIQPEEDSWIYSQLKGLVVLGTAFLVILIMVSTWSRMFALLYT
jgi:hypothetical protein